METEEKRSQLRELLINKILETNSTIKNSKQSLKKLSDTQLVNSLFQNTILAEREFWVTDILSAINKLNPTAKISKNNTSQRLINKLIRIAQDVRKQAVIPNKKSHH